MIEGNLLRHYANFCTKSKIHKVSHISIDLRGGDDNIKIIASDIFIYTDTAIRRIRRFLKKSGVIIDYAVIPRECPEWETSFSRLNDVKYNDSIDLEGGPTCRFFVNDTEVAKVSDFGSEVSMKIDLTKLDEILIKNETIDGTGQKDSRSS